MIEYLRRQNAVQGTAYIRFGEPLSLREAIAAAAGGNGQQPNLTVEKEAFEIMHGERLVLVDRMGRIRGYYDADDRDRLLRDARGLTVGGRG